MTLYKEWVEANINNPNRSHRQYWLNENTILLVGYDKITNQGVNAIFKLDHCDKCMIGKEEHDVLSMTVGQNEKVVLRAEEKYVPHVGEKVSYDGPFYFGLDLSCPKFPYPRTVGTVIVSDADECLVQWPKRSTSGDDRHWCPTRYLLPFITDRKFSDFQYFSAPTEKY